MYTPSSRCCVVRQLHIAVCGVCLRRVCCDLWVYVSPPPRFAPARVTRVWGSSRVMLVFWLLEQPSTWCALGQLICDAAAARFVQRLALASSRASVELDIVAARLEASSSRASIFKIAWFVYWKAPGASGSRAPRRNRAPAPSGRPDSLGSVASGDSIDISAQGCLLSRVHCRRAL